MKPARLLFVVGAALAIAGVLPWLFFALGLTTLYQPIFQSVGFRSSFHPIAEVEGFLACFAVAFVFIDVPRRTNTAPPAPWQVAVAIAAPVAIVVAAFTDRWVVSQACWLVLLAVVAEFAFRRMRGAPLPPSFIWVPAGILMGAVGAVLVALGLWLGGRFLPLHEIGRGLLFQGMFTALVLGTYDVLVPFVAGEPATPPIGDGGVKAAHSVLCAVFIASFVIGELVSTKLGFGLRALTTFAVVAGPLEASPLPPDSHMPDRILRVCVRALPLGYFWVALAPEYRRAGLHIVYLGCFTALVIATTYATVSRRTLREALPARPWELLLGGVFLALALTARTLLELDPPHFHLWLGTASAFFLTAAVPWSLLAKR
jgi:hypothetical protein